MKELIEKTIVRLESVFKNNILDFFFTEKELHSYFLYLCISQEPFVYNNYLLIHAEYPTPFKCSYNDVDIVKLENDDSKQIRAHIDMVFINPKYIDWIMSNGYDTKYISGITQYGLFKDSNADLTEKYKDFYKECQEPILDYAIEFKYFRHGYLGTRYPIKNIIQDIEKLRLLKSYPNIRHNGQFKFVENTLSAIFVSQRGEYIIDSLKDEINMKNYNEEEYKIITMRK